MRITDSIVEKNSMFNGSGAPTLDMKYGGMSGYMPRIGKMVDGKAADEWVSNQAYVQQNIIPILIKYPLGYDFLPNSEKWIRTLKALMEVHPLRITGFDSGLTAQFAEHTINGAGEMHEDVSQMQRNRTVVNYEWAPKANKAITKFWDYHMRYLMKDPDVQKPLVTKFLNVNNDAGGVYTADFYSFTMLYIEPDTTQENTVDAWLCSNHMPKTNGSRTGQLDKTAAGASEPITIEFTSITLNTDAVIEYADKVLKSLSIRNKIPDNDLVLPANEINPNIEAIDEGYNQP